MERAPAAIIARVMIAAVFFITESSAQKTCRVIMSLCAAWATWSVHEAAARAGTTEVLQKPTKAEGQAKEGDVDGVERGVAAHPFEEDFYTTAIATSHAVTLRRRVAAHALKHVDATVTGLRPTHAVRWCWCPR